MLSALIVMGPLESFYSRQALIAESKGDWETAYTYGVQARHYRNEGR